MRALVFLIAICISPWLRAETFSLQTFYEENLQKYGIVGNLIERKRITKGMTIGVSDLTYQDYYWGYSFTIQQPDNESYKLMGSDGLERSLDGAEIELSGSLDIKYYMGNIGYFLTITSDIVDTPFFKRGISGTYEYKAEHGLTIYRVKASYYKRDMPLDYFRDENLAIQQRPTEVFGRSLSAEWEQVVSGSIRSLLKVAVRDRKNERPMNYGSELRVATAINDEHFVHWNALYYKEKESRDFKSDIGYFTYYRLGFEYVFEPYFEYLVSLGYHYTNEKENNPVTGYITQVGTDSYSVGGSFMMEWGQLTFSTVYSVTNREEKLLKFNAGVKIDF